MPDANVFVEKRAHPRFQMNLQAKFSRVQDPKEIDAIIGDRKREMFSLTRDISLGGLGITTEEPLKEGDLLHFEINLPGRPAPLSALAEVIWTIDKKAGLRFLKIGDEDLETLKQYLHSSSP